LALLVAEYGLLLQQLDVLADSIASQMAPLEGSSSSHGIPQQPAATVAATAAAAGAGKSPGLSIVNDDLLTELAAEIPDLRYRVGVSDAEVFGANPLSPTRIKLQVRENGLKVLEGVNFLTRGVRLLGSDVGNAGEQTLLGSVGGRRAVDSPSPWARKVLTACDGVCVHQGFAAKRVPCVTLHSSLFCLLCPLLLSPAGRLFMKAALGGTLRPREVAALRRTARDVFSFIPFVIILIIPLTPLGHVLVFGFIQRYFPGFFPSQFTNQRQDLMMRWVGWCLKGVLVLFASIGSVDCMSAAHSQQPCQPVGSGGAGRKGT
jgi:hypothetical protein